MKVSHQAKVGILAAIAIIIMILGVNFLKGRNILSRNINLTSRYVDAKGLTPSSPVYLHGVKVGQVDKVENLYGQKYNVLVEYHVYPGTNIPVNTIAEINPPLLLGAVTLVLRPGDSKELAVSGDSLPGKVAVSLTDQLGTEVAPVRQKVEQLMGSLDTAVRNINDVFTEETKENLRSSFRSVNNSMKELEGFMVTLDGPIKDRLHGILTDANRITANLRENNPAITAAVNNFKNISDTLRALRLKETIDQTNAAIASVNDLLAQIQRGEGNIGRLMKDDKIYANLQAASSNLDKLIFDIRNNPDQYLNFSVIHIGRKTKIKYEEPK